MGKERIKVRITKNSPYSEYGYYESGDIGYIDGYVNGNAVIILENGKFVKADLSWIEIVNEEDNNVNPELKESEDERIIKCVKYAIDKLFLKEKIVCDVHKDDVLAWLEKKGQVKSSTIFQHENKTCKENDDSLTREDDRIRKMIINTLNRDKILTGDETYDCVAWLEEQAGQKGNKGNEKEIPNSEQKLHEWSEIEDIAVHLENLGNTAMANTLRSFRPQANHEWSEEDEKTMNELINILEEISQDKKWDFRVISDNNKTKYVNWIKLIESRYRWKPSTAQMRALALACDGKLLSLDYLNSLYNDLKKL